MFDKSYNYLKWALKLNLGNAQECKSVQIIFSLKINLDSFFIQQIYHMNYWTLCLFDCSYTLIHTFRCVLWRYGRLVFFLEWIRQRTYVNPTKLIFTIPVPFHWARWPPNRLTLQLWTLVAMMTTGESLDLKENSDGKSLLPEKWLATLYYSGKSGWRLFHWI